MIGSPRQLCALLLVALAASSGCGKKPSKDSGGGAPQSEVEFAFQQASSVTGMPARYMIAAAYLESRLSPENATARYVSEVGDDMPTERGTIMTQTAFGLPMADLGLDSAKTQSATLEVQMDAYSRYVMSRLERDGVKLSPNPSTDDEKLRWIQNLAVIHRGFLEGRINAPIIFAQELIQILNKGFVWQDPRNGQALTLEPENPPILLANLPLDGQRWLTLNKDQEEADVGSAIFLPLMTSQRSSFKNKPKGIEVIHCPLSLSACLELQTRTKESDVQLAAHYVIPSIEPEDPNAPSDVPWSLKTPIQLVHHQYGVIVTNDEGQNVSIQDKIVIMLTGNSGRIVAGERRPAIPTWFTHTQLVKLASLINDICLELHEQDAAFDHTACVSPDGDLGVRFRHQGGEEYRWGDIADYDSTIFKAYLRTSANLSAAAAFNFPGNVRQFPAGDISFYLTFGPAVQSIVVESLERCASGQLTWRTKADKPVRNVTQFNFLEPFYSSGPNGNGNQFFRARVYDRNGELLGWSIDQVLLSGFDEGPSFAPSEYCAR